MYLSLPSPCVGREGGWGGGAAEEEKASQEMWIFILASP